MPEGYLDTAPGPTQLIGQGHQPLRTVVCDELRRRIVNGDYEAGSRLIEEHLATDLGVSRSPVREALRVLESEGFVNMTPRYGAYVATLSTEEVVEIFEIRSVLEALAARLAARNSTAVQSARLGEVLTAYRSAVYGGDPSTITALNADFHDLVLELSGNRRLREVLAPLRGRLQRIFRESVKGGRPLQSLEEHEEIARAIEQHAEDLAADIGRRHVERARQSFLDSRDE